MDIDEVRQIWRGEVMDGFEGMEENFIVNTLFYWKPMELV